MFLAAIDITRIIREAGLLIYPLFACSIVAVFIIAERIFALRMAAVIPDDLSEAVIEGRTPAIDRRSVLGRILDFSTKHIGDPEAIKAFARLEVSKMGRGIHFLDIIYAAAPLIGLIGTVTGLLGAFSVVDPQTKMPDPVQFTESVGYALSATILGLCIALPALVGSGHLQRLVEKRTARLDLLLERVLARSSGSSSAKS